MAQGQPWSGAGGSAPCHGKFTGLALAVRLHGAMTDLPLPHDLPDPDAAGDSNPDPRCPIGTLIAERLARREALLGLAAAALAPGVAGAQPRAHDSGNAADGGPSSLTFPELRHRLSERDTVAEGYEIQTLIRWGDAVLAEAPGFDPQRQTPEAQAAQFGYNNDYLRFIP